MAGMTIARLKKRWRVLKAAITQDWHTHSCRHEGCDETWLCMGKECRSMWPENECRTHAEQGQQALAQLSEDFILRQRRRLWV